MNLFDMSTLEGICKVLGDTATGLTGSQIGHLLSQVGIVDTDPSFTKWKRLYNAFCNYQNSEQKNTKIFDFIKLALHPAQYVNNENDFLKKVKQINLHLAFIGKRYNQDGSFSEISVAKTISDAQQRANNLKEKLERRKCHSILLNYCRAELLQDNYFHAVFEAIKGLLKRIRDLSGTSKDGTQLVEYVFSNNPILIINNFQSPSEKDEHKGFCNILKGLCGMFRNPEAHEPKICWKITEQDALEILSMVSYCYRRLDKAQKIRLSE